MHTNTEQQILPLPHPATIRADVSNLELAPQPESSALSLHCSRGIGAVEPIISPQHSEWRLFIFGIPGERPLPIFATVGSGHAARSGSFKFKAELPPLNSGAR
jgi:hypothetical protein